MTGNFSLERKKLQLFILSHLLFKSNLPIKLVSVSQSQLVLLYGVNLYPLLIVAARPPPISATLFIPLSFLSVLTILVSSASMTVFG